MKNLLIKIGKKSKKAFASQIHTNKKNPEAAKPPAPGNIKDIPIKAAPIKSCWVPPLPPPPKNKGTT